MTIVRGDHFGDSPAAADNDDSRLENGTNLHFDYDGPLDGQRQEGAIN
jgi:hypothetical protein